jgi:hypothetical protein
MLGEVVTPVIPATGRQILGESLFKDSLGKSW